MKRILLIALGVLPAGLHAQSSSSSKAYAGNKAFAAGQFAQAVAAYRAALAARDTSAAVTFNLGTALLQDKKPAEARAPLGEAAARAARRGDKATESAAHYNLASTYLTEQKWQEAADAARASLKKNPYDRDAKYNLSYALAHLKKNGGGGGGKNDKGKGGDGREKDESPSDEGNNKSKLSQDQAEQILDAVSGSEKDLQKRLRKGKGAPFPNGKDW